MAKFEKSRHDWSHHVRTTYPMGYAVPTLVRELSPGDSISLRCTDVFRLEPFSSPIMDTVHAISSVYFVPYHQLYEGFERFLTGVIADAPNKATETVLKNLQDTLPWIHYAWNTQDLGQSQDNARKQGWDERIGLFTHLGIPAPTIRTGSGTYVRPGGALLKSQVYRLNALAFLAYHKIIDDYYRDAEMEFQSVDWPIDVMKHSLLGTQTSGSLPIFRDLSLDYTYWSQIRGWKAAADNTALPAQTDSGYSLRRANWEPDYLTTRRPQPQRGEAENIVVGADGMIGVDEMREAVAIQNLTMSQQNSKGRLDEFYRANFGISDSDVTFGKCEQIDHESMGLQISDINQTSETTEESPQGNTVGYSRTVGVGQTTKYTARSFGVLIRLTRVIPRTSYMFTIDPIHTKTTRFDFFNQKLEAIGWQPVPRAHVLALQYGSTTQAGLNATQLSEVTGWQPPYEVYRRQLSFTRGAFSPLANLAPFDEYHFARNFSNEDSTWDGRINPNFRKSDPSNAPFADSFDSATQVQHYSEYSLQVESVVPHAMNNRCLTH